MLGKDKPVAVPCDDEMDGKIVRSWDVFWHGRVVAQGFATRALARRYARTLCENPS